jgi:diguanylate cyclase (GGDEF)-like protein
MEVEPEDFETGRRPWALPRLMVAGARSYDGADRTNATRIVAAICALASLLTAAFLPLCPPTEAIGSGGWAVALIIIALGLLSSRRLLAVTSPPSFALLLAVRYAGLGATAVLEWLAGGTATAYSQLALLWVGQAMGMNPLRRALGFLLVVGLVTAAPLLYSGWSDALAAELAANYLFAGVLGLLMLALMSYVRAQRIELREGQRQAHELAHSDPLTRLGNRRAFDEALDAELGRSRRAGSTTSIVLLDLDRFKDINDRFGHLDGDRCLRDTAAAILRALRAGDRAFRWGGDEFVLLLPDTDLEGAQQAAERVASEVLNTCAAADGTPLSVSWGGAEDGEAMSPKELLGSADLALMALKREKLRAG